ncbi:MAG: hypothetical protein RR280_04205 [Bacteroidaceae bacterium]
MSSISTAKILGHTVTSFGVVQHPSKTKHHNYDERSESTNPDLYVNRIALPDRTLRIYTRSSRLQFLVEREGILQACLDVALGWTPSEDGNDIYTIVIGGKFSGTRMAINFKGAIR